MSRTTHHLALLLSLCAAPALAQRAPATDWPANGGDRGGSHYSPLAAIDRGNVARLEVAWRFSTGEAKPEPGAHGHVSFEATPLVIAGTMYFSTPFGRVFALDATTGAQRWRYDARVPHGAHFGDFASRGVSYWVDARAARGSACAARIIVATIDARLIALDAATGTPCAGFGRDGVVDLRNGLRNAPFEFTEYEVTSPPAIVRGVIVVGSGIADNNVTTAASGEVRGFDARTGALRWSWDPVPQAADDPAYATWRGPQAHRTGAANAWSVIAADTALGLVYVPTTSPSPDYYGGERLGDNHWANSIVALRAESGALAWAFQTVHHDLWDYDNASPPALVTVRHDGRAIPAVLQATKTGMLYVLDRATGKPIVPVEERAVPPSDVAGEEASPTQPFSTLPPLSPHALGADQAFGVDSADRAACHAILAGARNEGIFTPPSLRGTIAFPSNIGGAHWGGVAFDPARQLAIVPVNEIAAIVQLIPRDSVPAHREAGWEYAPMRGTPFYMRRRIILSPAGVPCSPPPFGSLVAVNVETGTIAWRVPLGTPGPLMPNRMADSAVATRAGAFRAALAAANATAGDSARLHALGSPNLGGAIVTAGGVVFVAATLDHELRAFDIETGRELWHGALPASGKATPMTYAVGGKQYVAIAAGGDGEVFGKSDQIVVFGLPR